MVEQRSSKKHSNKTQEEKGSIIDEDPQIKKKRESAASILSDNLSKPELYIRSDRDYEGNALQLLKYKLAKIEKYVLSKTNDVKQEISEVESLTAKIKLTEQQIELFMQESEMSSEQMKDSNWRFTKELCLNLAKIKNPTSVLIDLIEKFMFLLDQKEKTWKAFKATANNFAALKNLMNSFSVETLSEDKLADLLYLSKNYKELEGKMGKISEGAQVLLSWMSATVQFKLKKETLNNSKKRLVELKKKIKEKVSTIVNLNKNLSEQQGKGEEIKNIINNLEKNMENNEATKEITKENIEPDTPENQKTPRLLHITDGKAAEAIQEVKKGMVMAEATAAKLEIHGIASNFAHLKQSDLAAGQVLSFSCAKKPTPVKKQEIDMSLTPNREGLISILECPDTPVTYGINQGVYELNTGFDLHGNKIM